MTSAIDLLSFSMKKQPPKAGEDWFRVVAKKGEPTKVYIYDEIGYWGTNAKDFAAQLSDIKGDWELHINSPGGSVFDGLAIGAAIKSHPGKVTGFVDGMAASAASFILQYCDVRNISRNAQVMIHDAKAYAGGNAAQMRKAAELLDRVSDNIADIYAVRSGQGTKASWRETMVEGDTWYDGNEALAAGLVDSVTDNPEEEEDVPDNSWTREEIDAFLVMPAAQLAQDSSRSVITNRVEEALMTGEDPNNKNTPPTPPTPPAPAVQATQHKFMVNGVEVLDFAAVQNHITSLESFKTTTIKNARDEFVKSLAAGVSPKIAATQIDEMTEFANSLTDEQFGKWKASMDAAPAPTLLQKHGVEPGDQSAPVNGGGATDLDKEISTLQGICDAHAASGMPQVTIETKDSWKRLQELKNQKQASAS